MQLTEYILSAIAPHECLGCGHEGRLLCSTCALKLPQPPSRCYGCGRITADYRTCNTCRRKSSLSQVWPAALYQAEAKAIIHRLKFERARAAAADMAALMAARLPAGFRADTVTFVPTATTRLRQRGYDQGQLIAKELARLLNCPHAPLLARLTQHRQVGAGGQTRREQLCGAFRPRKPYLIKNQGVLLVDDVLTTGATLEEAGRVLRAAGAAHVSAVVFAQA